MILQHGGSERLSEAREEFERELQLDPQHVYSNFFLGVLASNANDHSKAIRYLLETTRLNPTSWRSLPISRTISGRGRRQRRRESLRRAIELTPMYLRMATRLRKRISVWEECY